MGDNNNTEITTNVNTSSSRRKRKSASLSCPKPGDYNYKTPTQLRNARKRRKLQRDKSGDQNRLRNRTPSNGGGTRLIKPKLVVTKASPSPSLLRKVAPPPPQNDDPSLKYVSDPKAAPTVQAAKRFFENIFRQQQPNQQSLQQQAPYKFPIIVGPKHGWRTVARLAVRRTVHGTLTIGLFLPGSHQLLSIPQCHAHHSSINDAVQIVQHTCRQLNIQAFDEHLGIGNLRYVALSIERVTAKQQIVLIWKEGLDKQGDEKKKEKLQLHQLIQTLIKRNVQDDNNVEQKSNDAKTTGKLHLHSLWIHYNNSWKHSNSVLDRNGRWEQQYGEKMLEEVLLLPHHHHYHPIHVPLYFPPQVFRQANLDGFANIVVKIRQWLLERLKSLRDNSKTTKKLSRRYYYGHCLELYGGVGTIGLNVIDLFDSLESSDENPHNQECFELSVNSLSINEQPLSAARRQEISYRSQSATDLIRGDKGRNAIEKADVIIVDPPRKGLDAEVIQSLNEIQDKDTTRIAKSLIYVSCGFDAFRRDYQALVKPGRWILNYVEGHILFPGSDAIETLAFFVQSKTSSA